VYSPTKAKIAAVPCDCLLSGLVNGYAAASLDPAAADSMTDIAMTSML
jgi:hypothetical protein